MHCRRRLPAGAAPPSEADTMDESVPGQQSSAVDECGAVGAAISGSFIGCLSSTSAPSHPPPPAAEEVLLDENEEAKRHTFYMVAGFEVSPDHK